MNPEWTLVLKMMTEPRQAREQYKTLPPPPAPADSPWTPTPAYRLTDRDRAMIQSAIRRAAECATGRLMMIDGLAVPEFRAGCLDK